MMSTRCTAPCVAPAAAACHSVITENERREAEETTKEKERIAKLAYKDMKEKMAMLNKAKDGKQKSK
jgi:hypothetical protein